MVVLIPNLNSYITQASFPEFLIDGHFYASPNQRDEPPTLFFSHSQSLPDDAPTSQLHKRVWALHNPYHRMEAHSVRKRSHLQKMYKLLFI